MLVPAPGGTQEIEQVLRRLASAVVVFYVNGAGKMILEDIPHQLPAHLDEVVPFVLVEFILAHDAQPALEVELNADRHVENMAMVRVQAAHVGVRILRVQGGPVHSPLPEDLLETGDGYRSPFDDAVVLGRPKRQLHRHDDPLQLPAGLLQKAGNPNDLVLCQTDFPHVAPLPPARLIAMLFRDPVKLLFALPGHSPVLVKHPGRPAPDASGLFQFPRKLFLPGHAVLLYLRVISITSASPGSRHFCAMLQGSLHLAQQPSQSG